MLSDAGGRRPPCRAGGTSLHSFRFKKRRVVDVCLGREPVWRGSGRECCGESIGTGERTEGSSCIAPHRRPLVLQWCARSFTGSYRDGDGDGGGLVRRDVRDLLAAWCANQEVTRDCSAVEGDRRQVESASGVPAKNVDATPFARRPLRRRSRQLGRLTASISIRQKEEAGAGGDLHDKKPELFDVLRRPRTGKSHTAARRRWRGSCSSRDAASVDQRVGLGRAAIDERRAVAQRAALRMAPTSAQDRMLGRMIGRALAHEIGHYLLRVVEARQQRTDEGADLAGGVRQEGRNTRTRAG